MNRGNETVIIALNGERTAREDVRDARRCRDSVAEALAGEGYAVKTLALEKRDFARPGRLEGILVAAGPGTVFNLFEGFSDDAGKEIEFVKALEKAGISFTGNSSRALSVCLDKGRAKAALRRGGVPVPAGRVIRDRRARAAAGLDFPVFVKPCAEDASVGIEADSLVADRARLGEALEKRLRRFPQGVIVEEFIGGKEYNVGFIGDRPPRLLGISVIDYSRWRELPPFLTYRGKWKKRTGEYRKILPSPEAKLAAGSKNRIIELAARAGEILGCRGYFRVDLREKGGVFFVLDVNPNPDINQDSGFVRQAGVGGRGYPEVIMEILKSAIPGRSDEACRNRRKRSTCGLPGVRKCSKTRRSKS